MTVETPNDAPTATGLRHRVLTTLRVARSGTLRTTPSVDSLTGLGDPSVSDSHT